MSPYDFPGLVSGLVAFQLVLWGLVTALLAGLRAVLVRGQAGRGHWARGILLGALLPIAAGAALFALAELTDQQRFLDRFGAPAMALGAVAAGVWLAVNRARRGQVTPRAPGPDEPPPAG